MFTGSGILAAAAAQALTGGGRVDAIDTSESMLTKLEGKIRQFGIANVDVHNMPAHRLDFRRDYFHHVVCSLGLFWCPEPKAALREWWRVLRPGGHVILTGFAHEAFSPYADVLLALLRDMHTVPVSLPWEEYTEAASWRTLLDEAGFSDIVVH